MAEATEKKPTRRQQYQALSAQLKNERSSFEAHWRELSDNILPRRSRWYTADANKGDRRNQKIIDSVPTFSARTLRSGMMAGITSPARPWFRLTTPDPELAELGPVKEWLNTVTQRMRTVLLRSNVYKVLPVIYGDLGTFATAAMLIEEDLDTVVRADSFPIGSYWIALDERGKVGVFYREFRMTVQQLVDKFGREHPGGPIDWTKFSSYIKSAWMEGQRQAWVDVAHMIAPNSEYDMNKAEAKFKKYHSCYYELGKAGYTLRPEEEDRYLRESGYNRFPILAPRWEATGEDVYGTDCPGMTALGDIKALQILQKRKAQAVEKMNNPPLTGPSSLKQVKVSLIPGDVTYNDEREGQKGLRPIHEVNAPINYMIEDVKEHEDRIRHAFFVDLFLMLASDDRAQPATATEIDERKEEKLIALGPVLEQLNGDLLDPMIDLIFDAMIAQDLVPTPPEELQGVELRVEYVSMMAQAQKLVGLGGVREVLDTSLRIVEITQDPSLVDKVNFDQILDDVGDMAGVSPKIIRTDDEAQVRRDQRAQAQKSQQTVEAMREGAGAAKDLSGADLEGNNALTALVSAAKAGQVTPGMATQ